MEKSSGERLVRDLSTRVSGLDIRLDRRNCISLYVVSSLCYTVRHEARKICLGNDEITKRRRRNCDEVLLFILYMERNSTFWLNFCQISFHSYTHRHYTIIMIKLHSLRSFANFPQMHLKKEKNPRGKIFRDYSIIRFFKMARCSFVEKDTCNVDEEQVGALDIQRMSGALTA